jgi:hypothetical protein
MNTAPAFFMPGYDDPDEAERNYVELAATSRQQPPASTGSRPPRA